MGYKIYSNITCPNRKRCGKYWRRPSLMRNLLIVKHHAPYKLMYSKYQIIKMFENCFPNMSSFSWINPIPNPSQILILYFPTLRAFLPPSQTLWNVTIANWNNWNNWSTSLTQSLFILVIAFAILSYPIQPYVITSIG